MFIKDTIKYRYYIGYAIKAELKSQVANTVLGYLWWILDPLLNMLIYTMLVTFIFQKKIPNFPVYVYCALSCWKWAKDSMTASAKSLRANISILANVQIPVFVFPLINTLINFVKYVFGLIVLLGLVIIYHIPFTWHMIEIIPVICVNLVLIFSISLIFTHIGVIVKDFNNSLTHFLRVWFYASPGMYILDSIPTKYQYIWWFNPMTAIFASYRNVIMYGKSPLYIHVLLWLVVSVIIMWIGLHILYKNAGNYGKEA